ncbi:MAG: mechanosensitive ion channel [Neisseriaceae bacterium]|nr:mechanosensitive ion channel [Neisseriaceae bacterium]
MYLTNSPVNFETLLQNITTSFGLVQVLVITAVIVITKVLSLLFFKKYQANLNQDYFVSEILSHIHLPLFYVFWITICSFIWQYFTHYKPQIFPLVQSILLARIIISTCMMILRQALPRKTLDEATEKMIAMTLWLIFVSWILDFSNTILIWMDNIILPIGKTKMTLLTLATGLLTVLFIIFIALWLSRLVERRLMSAISLDYSLRLVLSKISSSIAVIGAILFALPAVGIDLTILSVFGGALGVGLGFGLQKIASNYVSGFIVLLDRSIRLGDRIMIDNRTGYVTKMTSRFIVIKSADGSEALIPNEVLITGTVINQSYTDNAILISLPVQVAYQTDLNLALALLVASGKKITRIKQDPPPAAFVVQFGNHGIDLQLSVWLSDPENGIANMKSELNLAIWQAFKENQIQIPYPQQELRILT